ncbi:hypothetical protein IJI18_03135 [Candidatus Saccharibacteria bacterium]|nr:hypothetical protein [Candidatus Saccharibacteria bacterium]
MKKKSFLVGLMAALLAFLPLNVSALSLIEEAKLYFYGMNGIYYYRGTDGNDCNIENGSNQNYAGVPVWSEAELAAINENRAIYEEVANEYGFPWEVLAVFHSMETGLRRYNPSNGQGVYQLYSYTKGGTNENTFAPASSISEDEFRRQTEIAGSIISSSGGDLNNPDNVKKLFFKYNGASSKYIEKALSMGFSQEEAENGEGSAYVMNGYDARRDPSSSEMDSAWAGRYVRDGVYDSSSTTQRFGAFVKYEALHGNTYCEDIDSSDGIFGGDIVETALLLSWSGKGHSKNEPKPEYIEAMKAVGTYYTPCRNSSDCAPVGASCDIFVSTVMRYSGSDPSFPATGPVVQENYMQSHPEMYTQVVANDVSDLQPGDILVTTENGRHIYLNLGDGMQASASYNDRTGEHFSGVYLSDKGSGGTRNYNVYRRTH